MSPAVTPWEPIGLTDPWTTGPHVREAQRILAETRLGPFLPRSETDGIFGTVTAHAVQQAKLMAGYPRGAVNHTFGAVLHGYLTGAVPLPGPNRERRARRVKEAADHPSIRDNMVRWCRWGIDHEPGIHYAQIRPVQFPPQGTEFTSDCSGSTLIFGRWAGVPAHPGFEYSGAGSSMDMGAHMRHIPGSALQPGDLACWPSHHVVVVLEPGADPMVESHGMERGPLLIKLSEETTYHGFPPVFLSLL